MKLLIFLLGVAFSQATTQGLPSFKISGYSRSNVPDMSVTFENGETHEMVLEPYSETPCNFIGQLKNHPSSLAVTGCLNTPEDKMHITLLSHLNTNSATYEMDFEGHVTADENPFEYQTERSGIYPLKNRAAGTTCENEFSKNKDNMGDEEEDLALELKAADAKTSAATTWPKERYAYVKFGTDITIRKQLRKDKTQFSKWIDSVMTHVQSHYRHPSLPTKIQFKYNKRETIHKREKLPSTESLRTWSQYGQDDADPKVDLYCAFGKDSEYYGTVGLAWVGGACNDYIKTSFNEWRKTPTATAMVVSHEMGHNFGMSHDFDDKHGGDGSPCNSKGIMSYGDAPAAWSKCSVSDFTGYYNSNKWGDTCLASWDAYVPPCADKCPDCGVQPNTICDNPASFGGCKGQFQSYFDEYCKKTCGVCK